MLQHIGIVCCSAEGAALCYRTLCLEGQALLGPYRHPEISTHTPPLSRYMTFIEREDWDGVGEVMLDSAERLALAGADFLICPDNTMHQALGRIARNLPLPWLHIAEAVADEAVRRGFRHLGLTGTRWLMASEVYPAILDRRGLSWLLPTDTEREGINRIILEELTYGVCKPEAVAYFQQVIGRMQDAGADAVVLGCTEIPLLMNDGNSPLPTLDSTRLLARAALHRAIGAA